jgi:hypothetical protein
MCLTGLVSRVDIAVGGFRAQFATRVSNTVANDRTGVRAGPQRSGESEASRTNGPARRRSARMNILQEDTDGTLDSVVECHS